MSLIESFGNVFIEAWASGLPVIGHDTERLRWILGAESQLLCDTEDPAALLGMLRAGLARGAARTGKAQGIERYSWPVIAASIAISSRACLRTEQIGRASCRERVCQYV